jgi:hypothetical protein
MKYGQVYQNAGDGQLVFVVCPIATDGWFLVMGIAPDAAWFWLNETDVEWVRCED